MSTQATTGAEQPSGWIEFAAIVMFAVGFFRIISAIAYFADSHKINDLSAPTGDLDSAWNDFSAAVKNVPSSSSVSDAVSSITSSAQALVSAAETTASDVNCSSSSSSS